MALNLYQLPEKEERGVHVSRRFDTLLARIVDRPLPLLIPLILLSPTLFLGFVADDYFHQLMLASSDHPLFINTQPILDLFSFIPADGSARASLIEQGVLPWWHSEGTQGRFFRPVAALTHIADHMLWAESAFMQHLHSLAWLVACGFCVRRLYKITGLSGRVLGLAVVFFLVDEAHVMPAGWIANRNILICLVFSCCSIEQFIRWRQGASRLYVSMALYILSILSSEGGVVSCGYAFAWVWVYEHKMTTRLKALAPLALVTVVWRVIYGRLGYGLTDMGLYTDPLAEPFTFLLQSLVRIPTLLSGLFLQAPIDILLLFPDSVALGIAAAFLVFLLRFGTQVFQFLNRSNETKFWGIALILSLIPFTATLPMSRLLLIPSVAAAALFALYLKECTDLTRHPLYWLHVPLACCLCVLGSIGLYGFKHAADLPSKSWPEKLTQQAHIIYFNGFSLPAGFSYLHKLYESEITPASVQVLSHATQSQVVERLDSHTLRITSDRGWLHLPIERMLRNQTVSFKVNSQIRTPRFLATVERLTPDDRPQSVRFRFDEVLEHPMYRWVCFRPMTLTECDPPTQGKPMHLDGIVSW